MRHIAYFIVFFGLWVTPTARAQMLVELRNTNTQNTTTEAYHRVRLLPGFSAKGLQNTYKTNVKNICWLALPILGPNKEKLNLSQTGYNVILPQTFMSTLTKDGYYQIAKKEIPTETYYVQLKQTLCTPYALPYTPGAPYDYHPLFTLQPNAANPATGTFTQNEIIKESQNSPNELVSNGGENKFCGVVIVLGDQDTSQYQSNLTTTNICYTHDAAGNLTGVKTCVTRSVATNSVEKQLAKAPEEETVTQEGPVDLGDSFVAYPNPTDGLFYLAWNNHAAEQLASIDIAAVNTGFIIPVAYKNTDLQTTIDLSNQPPGIYVVRIVFADGTTKSIKVIRR